MIDLSTRFAGLILKNPLVPSASPLMRDLEMAKRLEDAGASALVMHSMFEEELAAEEALADRFLRNAALGQGEADGCLPDPGVFRGTTERYLEQLVRLKRHLDIPVIASLNGISRAGWIDLGREIEAAGADALELNVYYVAADLSQSAADVESRYVDLLNALREAVRLPIVMKLSPHFTSLPHFVKQLETAGASGVALFNRFYQPDIDLDTLRIDNHLHLSSPDEALLRLRWLAILRGQAGLSLAATGGVHGHEEALKMLLAGADVVQMASCLLRHGPERLADILAGMTVWMESREYASVAQLKGCLSLANLPDPSAVARDSYIHLVNPDEPAVGVWY